MIYTHAGQARLGRRRNYWDAFDVTAGLGVGGAVVPL